jgi:phosphoglycolate phosphatase
MKLEAFDLAGYFSTGAFGDDDADRNKLLPIALSKLTQERSVRLDYKDCVVIGDTPRDIECSKPYGAFAIAVATGPYSFDALTAADADIVFHDLSDTDAFLRCLDNHKS